MVTKLFNYDSKGKLREWTIEVEIGKFRTIHGLVGGKLQTSTWYEVTETNVGRANHRDLSEQALFEANAIITKQKEQGWRESTEELNNVSEGFDCMLAQKWEDRKDEISFPVYSQPKLDGIRCNISADKVISRNKKEFKSISHLEWIKEIAKEYNCIFDGELYNHEFKHDFNKITSLVKKTKPTAQDLEDSRNLIQYHIYDCFFLSEPSLSFKERAEKLKTIVFNRMSFKYIHLVVTSEISSSDDLDSLYASYIQNGYEGQMIRTNSSYEQKRSKTLLKRKEFTDAEYKVLDVCEGNGNRTGTAGFMILENRDGSTFKSNVKGSREWLSEVLKDKNEIIGKMVTVQSFGLTPDGVPRFPFVISIRDYE